MKLRLVGAAVVAGALLVMAANAGGLSFGVTPNATSSELGLPFYPGARIHKDNKDDSGAANVWGSLGSFGMKVVAVELDSDDAPAKVATFYAAPLAKYGPVADCSYGKPHTAAQGCADDHPRPRQLVYKAGTKREFHIVSIEPNGRGSRVGLVYIQMRGFD